MAKKKTDYRQFRRNLDLNQSEFWNRLGLTQSAGSRYEGGRAVHPSVVLLFDLAYGKNPLKALAKLRGVDISILMEGRL